MADPSAIATKDIVGWICAGTGIAVSLIWNLVNRFHTDAVAKRLRGEAFDFDEWKNCRSSIESRVQNFQQQIELIVALSRGAHDTQSLRDEIAKLGHSLVDAHEALITQLFRKNLDWVRFAYGREDSGETDWDKINSALADIASSGDDADALRVRLLSLKPLAASIEKFVDEAVRTETAEHHPNKI